MFIIDNIFNFVNNIIENLTSQPLLLFQMGLFSGIFIFSVLISHMLLFKKKPNAFYNFLFQDEKKLRIIILFICITLSFLWDLYFFSFTKDDAWITFRYSKNFVNGNGIVFNPGWDPVEGYSNFLWIFSGAIPHLLNIDPVIYTKIFSIILNFCTIIMVYKFTTLFYDKNVSLFAPILYALYYPFHLWTIGCLETPLLLFLIICAFYFAYKETQENNKYPKISFIFSFLVTLTRPDGIIYIVGLEGSLIFYHIFLKKEKKIIFQRIFSSLIVGVLYLNYFVWRFLYYGYFFPNTYYVKRSSSFITEGGIEYLGVFFVFTSPIILLMLIGIYKIIFKKKDWKKIIFLVVPILINFAIVLNLTQFNTAQGFRFILPAMPFIIIISIYFFQDLKEQRKKEFPEKLNFKLIINKYVPFLLILFLIIIPMTAPLVFKNTSLIDTNEKHYIIGKWFDKNVPKNATVAYIDMGIVPYYCELNFIDMWGLMDEHIAHEGFSSEYVLSQNPTFILFKKWGPDFSDKSDFKEKYELFCTVEFKEITAYLDEIVYDLKIYKLKNFIISNDTLVAKFT